MHERYLRCALPVFLAVGAFAAGPAPTAVPAENPKIVGFAPPNTLSPELFETIVAQGSNQLEIPAGVTELDFLKKRAGLID